MRSTNRSSRSVRRSLRGASALPILLAGIITLGACQDTEAPTAVEPPLTAAEALASVPPLVTVIENLGLPPGATAGEAHALNAKRQVVGTVNEGSNNVAFVWEPQAGIQSLEPFVGGPSSSAFDINDSGVVVGSVGEVGGPTRAWSWSTGFPASDLGVPVGVESVTAYGINNAGLIVGEGKTGTGEGRWVVAQPLGGFIQIGTFPGSARGINASGIVAGSYLAGIQSEGRVRHPLPQPGLWLQLPRPVTSSGRGTVTSVNAINQGEVAVGYGPVPTSATQTVNRGLVWKLAQTLDYNAPLVLGTLGGATSFAHDINDDDLIVGTSRLSNGDHRGFKQSGLNGSMTALHTLGGTRSGANGVNNDDHIVGWSTDVNGTTYPTAWWRFRKQRVSHCICPPPVLDLPVVRVTMMGSKSLKVRDIEMSTVTIAAVRESSPRVSIEGSGRELQVEYRDTNRDGFGDAVMVFNWDQVVELGLDREFSKGILLTGASLDRSYAVAGVLEPPVKGR